jgi:Mu transposase, C-terminal
VTAPRAAKFTGSVPEHWDRALDRQCSEILRETSRVREVAAGIRIITRQLRDLLSPSAHFDCDRFHPPCSVVRYDPRDISRIFVARASGRFIEARWQDLTLPPVSLHEWRNELKARNKTARNERDTHAMMKAIAQKRQIVERANAATLLARETVVEKSQLDTG